MRLSLAVFVLGLFLLPGGLILRGMLRMNVSRRSRWWTLIGVGGLVLWVASLDVLGTMVGSFLLDAESLARYALYSAYAGDAISYLGLVALGIGMIRFADTQLDRSAPSTAADSL